jgi:putative aminopeptidase FrvX
LLIAIVILSTNTTNNKSKGVVDDASGVACVLELLHSFISLNQTQRKCNLWFVLTGAEESGTMGIRFFYDYMKDMKRERTIIHNFESLGKSINIVITKNSLKNVPNYYNLIQKQAKEKNFNLFINPFTRGIHTDGMYLARKNFSLFEYGSSEVGKYMHSDVDCLKNVDTDMLAELCEFIKSNINSYFD